MDKEVTELVGALRSMAKQASSVPSSGRTTLEKLATIALIHEQIKKAAAQQKMSLGRKALLAAGLTVPSAVAAPVGYKKGKDKGRKKGQREMYQAAKPFVMGARRRAQMAENVARAYYKRHKNMADKSASAGRRAAYAATALALPAASYYGGKHVGKKKGTEEGHREVARAATRDINVSKARVRRAGRMIRSMMRRNQQLRDAKSKGGK